MTIRDIAKLAEVSVSTVSRVLSGNGYVAKEKREKVLEIIEREHFVPSQVARSLSGKQSHTIAVIIPDITNEFFADALSGIYRIAENENYNVVIYNTEEDRGIEHRALADMERQQIDGAILTPVFERDPVSKDRVNAYVERGIPVVLLDRRLEGLNLDGSYIDNITASYDATKALIDAGHVRISVIAGPKSSLPGRARLEGFLRAVSEAKLNIPEDYITFGDYKLEKAYEMMKRLLELKEPPTAVFTANNKTTLGALRCLGERNYRLGKDISLVGFDQINAFREICYPLSVIERDAALQGENAAKLLFEKLCETASKSGSDKNRANENGERKEIKEFYVSYRLLLLGTEKIRREGNEHHGKN